jgi:AcrR family transcriptional regulator
MIMNDNKNMRNPVQARSIKKKEKIVNSALKLIVEKGFLATSIRDIVNDASVSIGTFYSYFKNKNDIYIEVLKKLSVFFFDKLKNEVYQELNKIAKLDDLYKLIISKLCKEYEAGKKIHAEIIILALTDRGFNKMYNDFRKEKLSPFIIEITSHYENIIDINDREAAFIVIFKTIEEISKHLVFFEENIARDRIINETSKMLMNYVIKHDK